jgi:hypothetical protein
MNQNEESVLKESSTAYGPPDNSVDLMLDDSLAMTPWERILANDDIINFGDSLRLAMEKRNAKSR